MKYKFFENVKTVEDLKAQYKKLAFKNHPDRGGNVENMKQINAEYDELLKFVGNKHVGKDGKIYTDRKAQNVPDRFKDIINAIINFNCRIELCGSWLWLFNGYAYREELRKLGFFWCNGKKAWAWTERPTESKIHYSLDAIRRMHGSQVVREEEQEDEKKQLKSA